MKVVDVRKSLLVDQIDMDALKKKKSVDDKNRIEAFIIEKKNSGQLKKEKTLKEKAPSNEPGSSSKETKKDRLVLLSKNSKYLKHKKRDWFMQSLMHSSNQTISKERTV